MAWVWSDLPEGGPPGPACHTWDCECAVTATRPTWRSAPLRWSGPPPWGSPASFAHPPLTAVAALRLAGWPRTAWGQRPAWRGPPPSIAWPQPASIHVVKYTTALLTCLLQVFSSFAFSTSGKCISTNDATKCICTLCYCTLYVTLSMFFCVWTSFNLLCVFYMLLWMSLKDGGRTWEKARGNATQTASCYL